MIPTNALLRETIAFGQYLLGPALISYCERAESMLGSSELQGGWNLGADALKGGWMPGLNLHLPFPPDC